jgi:hypothetical protein
MLDGKERDSVQDVDIDRCTILRMGDLGADDADKRSKSLQKRILENSTFRWTI